jgi:hypothetical protein
MLNLVAQVCKRCSIEKEIADFYLNPKTGNYWGVCSQCRRNPPSKIRDRIESKSITREEKANLNIRECLNCEQEFNSVSKFNRLCENCKRED